MSGRRAMGLSASAWFGLVVLALFTALAAVGPVVAPHSPTAQNLDLVLAGPSASHWFGTDANGRDLFSAMLHGARLALLICGGVVGICALVGVSLGLVAGYFGGWVDEVVMRTVDVLLSFPGILLNLAIVATVRRPGIGVVMFALCLNGWVTYARVARGQVLSLREREFVAAARCLGAGPLRIMRRHILPNLLSPLLIQMTVGFGGIIAVEASLSFLGLGPQVSYTWGALLEQGTTFAWATQRLVLVPGVAIMAVVLASNLLGDGLRDRFDPRRRRGE